MNVPRKRILAVALFLLALCGFAYAQRDADDEPTSLVNFVVIKEDNGKPVRNAAVIMHPVNPHGKQGKGGMELKTDADGKTTFDGIPYGKLRVQVLASGFQTYGEDFDVSSPRMNLTIKLKRPQNQYSIYGNEPKDPNAPKQEPPPDKKNDNRN